MINERLIDTEVAAENGGGNAGEEGLILHLDANDVDSYDGDGSEWIDITNHEYTPATNVSEHFNTVLYTGNETSQSIQGVGFQPDFIWVKNRDASSSNLVFDSIRGNNYIIPNGAFAESTSPSNTLSSFDSDGFTVSGGGASLNNTNDDFVAWCFKAGGAAVSNTDGGISSNVSVNNDLAFSIVDYTATGVDSTVGHGLDVPPELIIAKPYNQAYNWVVYAAPLGAGKVANLNLTNAFTSSSTFMNDTEPTASVFTAGNQNNLNYASGDKVIAYCFASKRGVSKVGSFEGTGAAGNKVYTGFEPAFILTKRTSTSGSGWYIIDNKRSTDSDKNDYLSANTNGAEVTSSSSVTFNRDGFTFNGASFNTSGQTHIYYAIAKNTNETSLTPDEDLEVDLGFDPSNVNYSDNNYSFAQDNTEWHGNADTSSGSHEGEVFINNYFNSGDTDKYYFEVETVKSTNGLLGFTDPTKYAGGDGLSGGVSKSAHRNLYFYGISNASIYETNGSANYTSLATGLNTIGQVTSFAIDVATRKVWVGTVSGGSITWFNGGNPSTGVNPFFTLPSTWGSYHFIAVDGSYSSASARYGWFQIYRTSTATTLPTGFTQLKGAIKKQHLKLHLDAASFPQYGEAGYSDTPSTWTDSSGNSNNGTISGATFDSELGNWLDFDGSNDYIGCGSASNIIPAGSSFTIETWVNANNDTTNTYWAAVGAVQSGTPYGGFMIYNHHNTDNWGIALNKSGTWTSLDSGVDIEVGKWVHLAYTYDGSYMKLFLDGEERFSSYQSGSLQYSGSVNFEIGRNVSTYSPIKVGQVRAYSSPLTQDQIRQNYNFTKPSYPNGVNFLNAGDRANWLPEGSWNFNSNSNYLFCPEGAFQHKLGNSNFAFSAWLRTDTIASGFASIIEQRGYSDGSNNGFGIYRNGSSLEMYARAAEGSARQLVSVSGAFTASTWVHIVVQRTGTTWEVYVNGSIATNTGSYKDNSTYQTDDLGNSDAADSQLIIGRQWQANTQQWLGRMADIKFFSKALSAAEVTAQFAIKQFDIG